ncbi:Phosphate-selective porin O and P OS=Pirellula staleyi (strain ATCC 27377 / DSM 6068 / ICPB 4128) GN=Psta_4368 PE=4 SV=1: Porin_O_P [Gemmata massiliana]|uniref:Porin n=1 Tax=Gemmata massiliana TaxID=1210884 RepID=A0A6P2CVP0_9BACT|nr:porin [Gemmata massiliana]VTR91230.1 Phosphate-selective porin O and P OS=Pirellula staleyi (strain ATCC 27377 / DSM 6068 / ICPB 4128) GN=Psta_4368 PE=4 SV=1: Porin_O_P [Gemmata massiliana]
MTRWAAWGVLVVAGAISAPASAGDLPGGTTAPVGEPAPPSAPAPTTVAPTVPDLPASVTNPLSERLGLGLKPTFELRGRIEADAVVVSQSTSSKALIGDLQNGYGFRRARIGAQGIVGDSTRWVAEVDFANGNFRPRDLYVALTALPGLRELQVGYFREPFSLDGATSSRFITFMERSPLNELDPARDWGIAGRWWSENERATFALGAFRVGTSNGGFSSGDGGNWAVTTRLTGLPIYTDDEGTFRLVHIGGAFSHRVPLNGVVRYAPDAQSNILDVNDSPASPFLPTINIPASSQQLYNLQAAGVYGPFSMQSEWFGTAIQQVGGGPIFLHGFYVDASYFLTGEHRGYNRTDAAFSNVSVLRPLVRSPGKPATGFGAVELAARFALGDFTSSNLPQPTSGPFASASQGARLLQATFGANWYLNEYTRIMLNYTMATPEARGTPALPVHVFGFRTAIFW